MRLIVWFPALGFFLGCGGGEEPQKPASETKAVDKTKSPKPPPKETGKKPPTPSKLADVLDPPSTAEETVQAFLKSVRENRVEHVWDLLPASYQRDIEQTVRAAASDADPTLYAKAFSTWQRAIRVFQKQKTLLIAHPHVQNLALAVLGLDKENLAKYWDPLLHLAESFFHDDLKSLAAWKNFQGREFCGRTLNRVLVRYSQLVQRTKSPQLSDVLQAKIKVLAGAADTNAARLEMTMAGSAPVPADFVKVNTHWLPKSLELESWKGILASMRTNLQIGDPLSPRDPKAIAARKALVEANLKRVNAWLDVVEAATDQKSLDLAFVVEKPKPPPRGAAGEAAVILRFSRKLSRAENNSVFDVASSLLTEDLNEVPVAGGVALRPVPDPATFAKQLGPALTKAGLNASAVLDAGKKPPEITITIK